MFDVCADIARLCLLITVAVTGGRTWASTSDEAERTNGDTVSRIQVQSGHTAEITGIAMSPASELYATISKDNTVRLWTLEAPYAGSLIRVLRGHTKPVKGIEWSELDPDIIATYSEAEVILWNIRTGEQSKLELGDFRPRCIAFRPGNAYITVGCKDPSAASTSSGVLLSFAYSDRSLSDGKERQRSEDVIMDEVPVAISYTQDGDDESRTMICIGTEAGSVLGYKLSDKRKETVIKPADNLLSNPGAAIKSIASLRDRIYVVYTNGDVQELEYERGSVSKTKSLATFAENTRAECSVEWTSISSSAVVLTVKINSARSFYTISSENRSKGGDILVPVRHAKEKGTKHMMSVMSTDSVAVLISNTSASAREFTARMSYGPIHSGSNGSALECSFIATASIEQSSNAIRCVAFDPQGAFALSGDNSGTVVKWDLRTKGRGDGILLGNRALFKEFVNAVAVHPDGSAAALVGRDDEPLLMMYDLESDTVARCIRIAPDEPLMLGYGNAGTLCLAGRRCITVYDASLRVIDSLKSPPKSPNTAAVLGQDGMLYVATDDTIKVINSRKHPLGPVVFTSGIKTQYMTAVGPDSLLVLTKEGRCLLLTANPAKTNAQTEVFRVSGPASLYTSLGFDQRTRKAVLTAVSGECMLIDLLASPAASRNRNGTETLLLHDSKVYCQALCNTVTGAVGSPVGGASLLATGGLDGRIGFVNMADVKTVYWAYPLIRTDSSMSWVTFCSNWLFDANDGSTRHLRYISTFDVYSLDQLYLRFQSPRLLSRLYAATPPPPPMQTFIARPPMIRIMNTFNEPVPANVDEVKITSLISIRSTGVSRVRLYRNNTFILEDRLTLKGESVYTTLQTYDIPLAADTNIISLVIIDDDSTTLRSSVRIVSAKTAHRPVLYALCIGLDSYKDRSATLRYAKADANSMSRVLRSRYSRSYDTCIVTTLTDEAATIAKVREAFQGLRNNVTTDDGFIFFFAGHGVTIPGKANGTYALGLHDVADFDNSSSILNDGLPIDTLASLIMGLRPKNSLVLLDACYSGLAVKSFETFGGWPDRQMINFQQDTKCILLASADGDAKSKELDELGHSIFTHTILTCLERRQSTGDVDIYDLQKFIANPRLPASISYQRPKKFDSNIQLQEFALTRGTD